MADLRRLFEVWAADNHLDAHKATDGEYFDAQTAAAWFAWQGCIEVMPGWTAIEREKEFK